MSIGKEWSLLAHTWTGHMVDICNKRRITLNRWHTKHFLFCSTSQRRKQLTHKICHDILSQSALHLAVTFHNAVFLKWDAIKQSWSQRSPHQSLLSFCLFSVFLWQFSNFGQSFYCCQLRYQQILHEHPGYFFPAAFCSGSSPLISCNGSITWDTNLLVYLILSKQWDICNMSATRPSITYSHQNCSEWHPRTTTVNLCYQLQWELDFHLVFLEMSYNFFI